MTVNMKSKEVARDVAKVILKEELRGNYSDKSILRVLNTSYWGGGSTDVHFLVRHRKISVSAKSFSAHRDLFDGHTFSMLPILKEIQLENAQMTLAF